MARIGTFGLLRLVVALIRVCKSIDRMAAIEQSRLDLERERMAMEFPTWHKLGGKLPEKPRMTEISHAKVEDLNRRYREEHPDYED